ncbi:MAG TPA: Na+ dependent nucleoside transporter N-terminal domain-containing protein, partial [Gemmatimonadales bacterium]|nr:Na+ dependent nucleoside transporter N-terminal domain-containing protein [Gemmatimonadales bacterium]
MTGLLLLQSAAEQVAQAHAGLHTPLWSRLVGVLGIITMIGIAVLISYDRKKINWRLVLSGLAIQFVFGLIVLKTGPGRAFFDFFGRVITGL